MLKVIKGQELAGLSRRINHTIRELNTKGVVWSGPFIIYGIFSDKVLPKVIREHQDYLDVVSNYNQWSNSTLVFKIYDTRRHREIYYIAGVKSVAFELPSRRV